MLPLIPEVGNGTNSWPSKKSPPKEGTFPWSKAPNLDEPIKAFPSKGALILIPRLTVVKGWARLVCVGLREDSARVDVRERVSVSAVCVCVVARLS